MMSETGRRGDEGESPVAEIEITEAMIEAGAKVLYSDELLDLSQNIANYLARDVIAAALATRARENFAID